MHAAAGVETAPSLAPRGQPSGEGRDTTGAYADLPGARAWYETEGTGDPLALLHGGFCTHDTWERSAPASPPSTASSFPSGGRTDTRPTSKVRSPARTWPATRWTSSRRSCGERPIRSAGLARVRTPALVLVGDDDMMTLEHTTTLYRALPESQPAVVPGASHLAPLERPALVDRLTSTTWRRTRSRRWCPSGARRLRASDAHLPRRTGIPRADGIVGTPPGTGKG